MINHLKLDESENEKTQPENGEKKENDCSFFDSLLVITFHRFHLSAFRINILINDLTFFRFSEF